MRQRIEPTYTEYVATIRRAGGIPIPYRLWILANDPIRRIGYRDRRRMQASNRNRNRNR